jgi:hypothetical protein
MLKIKNNITFNAKKILNVGLSITLLTVSVAQFITQPAQAVSTTGFVRLDRMSASTTTSGTVCLTPQATGTEGKVVVTFPGTTATADATHFGIGQTFGSWTVNTTNLPTGATAWITVNTATAVSGGAVTFPSGDLVVGTQYCFNFAAQLSNPTSAGSSFTGTIQTQTSGGAAIDTVNYALATVASGVDQISVTATVPSTFTFNVNSGTPATAVLGTITTSSATSATAITSTVSTNANNGWLAWVKSTNAALNSTATGDSIPSSSYTTGAGNIVDLSSTNGYVLDVNTGTNSPTIATEYDGNTTSKGGNLATTFKQIASQSAPASGSTFDLVVRARATATNKAASDYADTLTVTAAGQF